MGGGLSAPTLSDGWGRLAAAVAADVPPVELDGIWTFPPVRRDRREWGTAILSRVDGDRRRIYTARYVLAVRGKERGQFEATIEEMGSGPLETLAALLRDVQKRSDDEPPPTSVDIETWFPAAFPAAADGAPQPG